MAVERWIRQICSCGCEKLTVPYHLKDADLWVSITLSKGAYTPDYVSFTLKYDTEPDNKGWRKKV